MKIKELLERFRSLEDPAGFLVGVCAVALAGGGAAYIIVSGVITWFF